jgi:hypothetical protein
MEMAGAAEADTPSQELVRTGRSNTILLPIGGILLAYLLYRFLRPRPRLRLDLPAWLRRRRAPTGGGAVLPYFAPIADRLGAVALPYLGAFAGPQAALLRFPGGEALSVAAILEAPGEVVAKSAHSTLYRAAVRSGEAAVLLRFVRPACADEAFAAAAARRIGAVRHPNLVPLRAVYVGPRGEKLLVYPFYAAGSLQRFLQGRLILHIILGFFFFSSSVAFQSVALSLACICSSSASSSFFPAVMLCVAFQSTFCSVLGWTIIVDRFDASTCTFSEIISGHRQSKRSRSTMPYHIIRVVHVPAGGRHCADTMCMFLLLYVVRPHYICNTYQNATFVGCQQLARSFEWVR